MLDHTGKFCLIVRRSELRLEVERLEDGTRPALQEGHHFLDLAPGPFVGGFKVIGPDACDEDELLLVRIKDDELVKEHEVDVLEIGILGAVKMQRRLGVLDIVVGEIADKAAGEGGGSPGSFGLLQSARILRMAMPGCVTCTMVSSLM